MQPPPVLTCLTTCAALPPSDMNSTVARRSTVLLLRFEGEGWEPAPAGRAAPLSVAYIGAGCVSGDVSTRPWGAPTARSEKNDAPTTTVAVGVAGWPRMACGVGGTVLGSDAKAWEREAGPRISTLQTYAHEAWTGWQTAGTTAVVNCSMYAQLCRSRLQGRGAGRRGRPARPGGKCMPCIRQARRRRGGAGGGLQFFLLCDIT